MAGWRLGWRDAQRSQRSDADDVGLSFFLTHLFDPFEQVCLSFLDSLFADFLRGLSLEVGSFIVFRQFARPWLSDVIDVVDWKYGPVAPRGRVTELRVVH